MTTPTPPAPKPDTPPPAPAKTQGSMGPPARERPPVPPRPDGEGGSPTSPGRPRVPGWLTWVITLGFLLVWNLVLFMDFGTPSSAAIPYSDFTSQVTAGNVATVEFNGQSVSGTFKQPVVWPPASGAPGASPAPSAAPTPEPPASFTAFTTVVPPEGDPALLPLLSEHAVVVSAVDATARGSLLSTILGVALNLLPVLLLVGFFVFSARQAQRNQQGILGIGRSNARQYNEERPKVTFDDVAGEDQAKIELREVVDFLQDPAKYQKLGARLPRGVLLIGPPGTGKTLLARRVAGEAKVPFFSITASEFAELLVGVGASRVP